jgi:calmodulin
VINVPPAILSQKSVWAMKEETDRHNSPIHSNPASIMAQQFASNAAPLHLTREEEREFREIFNLVDRDGGGSISKSELQSLMKTLAINASQAEIDLMINEIDSNNDGEIQFEEFVAVMARKVQSNYSAEEIKNAFKLFEGSSPSGYIKIEALERALTVYGNDRLTQQQVAELLAQIDCDSNGLFNYVEYVNMMMAE